MTKKAPLHPGVGVGVGVRARVLSTIPLMSSQKGGLPLRDQSPISLEALLVQVRAEGR